MAPTISIATKHCPGVGSLDLPAHDLPATGVHFSTNKSMKDGFASRCRSCDNAYGKAWLAAKKAGTKFSAKASTAPAVDLQEARSERRIGARAAAAAADDLAARLQPSLRPGWTTEIVGGIVYAIPSTEDTSTPEGQAALELVNKALDENRRAAAAAAKRAQRARAKAAAVAAATA
jgi:hypothetical protein